MHKLFVNVVTRNVSLWFIVVLFLHVLAKLLILGEFSSSETCILTTSCVVSYHMVFRCGPFLSHWHIGVVFLL